MKYVTKYILTKGILCVEDYEIVEDEPKFVNYN